MHTNIPLRAALIGGSFAFLLSACGPATFTRTRMDYSPYSNGELRQEKEGVIVELRPGTKLPATFIASVPRCDQYGRVAVDQNGRPVMEELSLARPRQLWHEMAITNHTDHVIRMNGVVPRLFDPSGSQYEALTRDDLVAQLYRERPCSSTQQAGFVFQSIKIFDRNIEVVPGTTSTFWVPYLPASKTMSGVWKFSVYEIPVKLDSAGRPLRTTQFHMRLVAKEITETLQRDSPFAEPKLVSSRESSPVTAAPAPNEEKPRPASPTARETSPSPATLSMREAQQKLAALGYDPGAADGKAGPRTVAALKRFQADNQLKATGQLDAETSARLSQRDASAPRAETERAAAPPQPNSEPARKEPPPPVRPKQSATDL